MYLDSIFNSIINTTEKNKDQLTMDYIDNYLNLRDSKNFDEKWSLAYEYFNDINHKNKAFLSNEKELRERLFKKVAQLTQSYELAEYISDDSSKQSRPTELTTHDKHLTYTCDSHGRMLYKLQTPLGKVKQALKQLGNPTVPITN